MTTPRFDSDGSSWWTWFSFWFCLSFVSANAVYARNPNNPKTCLPITLLDIDKTSLTTEARRHGASFARKLRRAKETDHAPCLRGEFPLAFYCAGLAVCLYSDTPHAAHLR